MARTMPKPPTRRTQSLFARLLAGRSTVPSVPCNSKPSCGLIRAAAPTASWSAGKSSTRLASASIRRATCRLQGHALGDGRHGQKPRTRSAAGIHPRQPQDRTRNPDRLRPSARPRARLQPRHRPRERPGPRNLISSYFPSLVRHTTTTRKALLRGRHCLFCLVSAAVRNSQQEAAQSCVSQSRIIRLKTVLSPNRLSRSTIYRKITDGTFPPQIRISIHGAGWRANPTINRWIADPVSWRPKGQFDEVC